MLVLANAGLPMLLLFGPLLLLALLPIVLIETGLYRWRLGVDWGKAALGSTVANLISTIFGVPLTWVALVVLQMLTGGGGAHGVGIHAVTWQAPWLIPYEEDLYWMVPAAGMFLCLPFLVASVLIEKLVLRLMWSHLDRSKIRLAVWLSNGVTYGCLATFWWILLVYEVATHAPSPAE